MIFTILHVTDDIIKDSMSPIAVAWKNATNTECTVTPTHIVHEDTAYAMSERLQEKARLFRETYYDGDGFDVKVNLVGRTADIEE